MMPIRSLICSAFFVSCIFVQSQGFANEWRIESEIDPFTDAHIGMASIPSSEGDPSWLAIHCDGGDLNITVYHRGERLDNEARVTSRVGKREAEIQRWEGLRGRDMLRSRKPEKLLTELLQDSHSKFAVRVWALNNRSLVSIFDTSGIHDAMKVITEAGCLLRPDMNNPSG